MSDRSEELANALRQLKRVEHDLDEERRASAELWGNFLSFEERVAHLSDIVAGTNIALARSYASIRVLQQRLRDAGLPISTSAEEAPAVKISSSACTCASICVAWRMSPEDVPKEMHCQGCPSAKERPDLVWVPDPR